MNQRAATDQSRVAARRARLVVMEEGAPAPALAWGSACPETTIVIGSEDDLSRGLAQRIDRRMQEAAHSGLSFGEVVFMLAARGGESDCSNRLSALLTVIGHLSSASEVEIALILPADTPAEVRHEVFALAEVIVAELGAGPNIRIRFVSNTSVTRESGFFTSARAASVRELPQTPSQLAKASKVTQLRAAG